MSMNIQIGHIARHTPRGAGAQGREAAVVDVAQDLLLAHMHEAGILGNLAIKGGTAIRKLYAGNEGRFSLDLDFAAFGADPADAGELFVMEADGLSIGPFTYGVAERRGKWSISFDSPFVENATLASKLDFSPQPWLAPATKGWVPMPIHVQYGFALPEVPTVRIEENIAEKVARLNRTTTARDMYDLRWIMTNPALAPTIDKALVRRLAVLKIWVDTNGMHASNAFWKPSHQGSVFDPAHWLRERDESEFDPEDIGALAVPRPSAKEMSDAVRERFAFLADLDADELEIAQSDPRSRSVVIKAMSSLPNKTFNAETLF
ncbi:MAG: nucleotidyl transferase AbiEii/AbiGii toxin family protein [Eggerthellaceae bacterium]|nr:nucleotidyl transferase AbiEii/AbiGii toxin family protein [Eggerthellaceae bacterium]